MKSQKGFDYEDKVLKTIKSAGIIGLIDKNAGPNPNLPDADFKIGSSIFNLEVKLNDKAQMGGSSIVYNKLLQTYDFATEIDEEIKKTLFEAVKSKQTELDKLIDYIKLEEKNCFVTEKFPLVCSKQTWQMAQKNNLLVNVRIPCSIEFLKSHLCKKNVFYIQIGGKGLYHIGKNPANIPVEEIKGNFTVEIRTGRSGSKLDSKGNKIVTGAIRVQGRLNITNSNSEYTFDNLISIQKLLKERNSKYDNNS